LGKIFEILGKIPEYLGKNGAQRSLISKNGAQRLQKNKRRPFFGGHTKKRSAKVGRQLFGQVRENFCTPKNLLASTPVITVTS